MLVRAWGRRSAPVALAGLGVALLAGILWFLSEPPAYQSSEGQHVDADDRYQYQPDAGCAPHELARLPTLFERSAQARACTNQAEDHRREVDDLTQQTRAAEAVEKANWLGEANLRLSRIQLILSALGAGGLLYSLYLTRRATFAAVRGEDAALAAVAEAQRSNEIAAEAALLDRRPWLHIGIAKIDKVRLLMGDSLDPGEEAYFTFWAKVTIRNAGKTPARGTLLFIEATGPSNEETDEVIRRAFLDFDATQFAQAGAIPPNSEITLDINMRRILGDVALVGNFRFITRMICYIYYGTEAPTILPETRPPFCSWQTFYLMADSGRHISPAIQLEDVRQSRIVILARPTSSDMT